MPNLLPSGRWLFPVQHFIATMFYTDLRRGETLKTLELIQKQKNGFGDMMFFIRDDRGAVCLVCERDVETYMQEKGVSSLVQGSSYVYPKTKKR